MGFSPILEREMDRERERERGRERGEKSLDVCIFGG